VIHTVGPVYRGGGHGEAASLGSAYRQSLVRAAEIGARSVAFPAISTGIYGYPRDEAARVAYAAVRDFLAANSAPEEVVLVFFADADADAFMSAANPA
jgi:O-acetyl-ADP-ribose deacetylase (regulator of RNase III)